MALVFSYDEDLERGRVTVQERCLYRRRVDPNKCMVGKNWKSMIRESCIDDTKAGRLLELASDVASYDHVCLRASAWSWSVCYIA